MIKLMKMMKTRNIFWNKNYIALYKLEKKPNPSQKSKGAL